MNKHKRLLIVGVILLVGVGWVGIRGNFFKKKSPTNAKMFSVNVSSFHKDVEIYMAQITPSLEAQDLDDDTWFIVKSNPQNLYEGGYYYKLIIDNDREKGGIIEVADNSPILLK